MGKSQDTRHTTHDTRHRTQNTEEQKGCLKLALLLELRRLLHGVHELRARVSLLHILVDLHDRLMPGAGLLAKFAASLASAALLLLLLLLLLSLALPASLFNHF